MRTVTLEEAKASLDTLIESLSVEGEIVILNEGRPVAKLVPAKPLRKMGTLKGTVLYMAPDFDEPLQDFEEYM